MRIIPRKIKVRNNVWKCYSMKDILVALVVFAIVFCVLELILIALTSISIVFVMKAKRKIIQIHK